MRFHGRSEGGAKGPTHLLLSYPCARYCHTDGSNPLGDAIGVELRGSMPLSDQVTIYEGGMRSRGAGEFPCVRPSIVRDGGSYQLYQTTIRTRPAANRGSAAMSLIISKTAVQSLVRGGNSEDMRGAISVHSA